MICKLLLAHIVDPFVDTHLLAEGAKVLLPAHTTGENVLMSQCWADGIEEFTNLFRSLWIPIDQR